MTPSRHGTAHIEFPNELDILITREFDAPIALVFDVLTKPEHVSKWGAYPSNHYGLLKTLEACHGLGALSGASTGYDAPTSISGICP